MRHAAFALLLICALPAWAGRTETRSAPLKNGGKLNVRTANSRIRVEGWDQEQVSVSAEIQDSQDRPVTWEIRPTAEGLDVEAHFPKFSWHVGRGPSCDFTLKVPRRLVGSFQTSNDSISAGGFEGQLEFRTSNDQVHVENLGGTVSIETSNGEVIAKHLRASLKGSTSNDSVRLEDVQGGVDFSTSNSNITASGLDGWGQGIALRSSNGDLVVELGQAKGEIHARTSRHETVKIERRGVELVEMGDGHEVRLRVPGSAQAIELSTSNGDITVK